MEVNVLDLAKHKNSYFVNRINNGCFCKKVENTIFGENMFVSRKTLFGQPWFSLIQEMKELNINVGKSGVMLRDQSWFQNF